MLCDYMDIRSRIDAEPLWFDEAGVPRYEPFTPDLVHDIYADEVALVLIACQECGEEYKVAFSDSVMRRILRYGGDAPPMSADVQLLHYGDPPCFECNAGRTMNCEDIKVLEFWRKDKFDWVRVPELEVYLPDGRDRLPDESEGA